MKIAPRSDGPPYSGLPVKVLLSSGTIPEFGNSNPAPLCLEQAKALLIVASRQLLWGIPEVSRELRRWRARAERIPDRPLREDALDSLTYKRDHAEGAALFWVLPKHRDLRLLRLLVAYQTIWDFLDNVSERDTGERNAQQLHLALVEALNPDIPHSDYYRHHPWKDDAGYLDGLVETCRELCQMLPSYELVRAHVLAGVTLCSIQSANHDLDHERRDATLRSWAEQKSSSRERALDWFEFTAAASGYPPHPLLALAADVSCEASDVAMTHSAYFPWVSLATVMLDSYVDQFDDVASGGHSYISHYENAEIALQRLRTIVDRSVREVSRLRDGYRHTTVVACMVAMYLSKYPKRISSGRSETLAVASAGGSLTCLSMPILRLWRAAHLRPATPPAHRLRSSRSALLPPAAIGSLPPGSPLPRPAQTFVIWSAPLAYLDRCRDRYGPRFTLNVTSHPPLVFLSNVEDIKAMFAAPPDVLHPGKGADTIEPLVGKRSFMLSEEDEHLRGRKAILPAFHGRVVQRHTDLVTDIVRREVASWPQDVPFALHPHLRVLTLKVMLRTTFGAWSAFEGDLRELRKRLLAMLEVTGSAVFPEPLLRHGPGRRIWERFVRQREEVDRLIFALIEDRRSGTTSPENVLGMLLETRNANGSVMSTQQVRDNIMSLIIAGHETTASELAWAFQLLAHSPVALGRLTKEIDHEASETYLTATVHEVLRHRPVFLFAIPRAVARPIEIGGWTYSPPTQLLGCIYLAHHDSHRYPEPHKFRPERFLETPTTSTLLAWGGGRKRCPGQHIATLELKTVLRTVLSEMTLHPAGRRMERARWRSVIVTPHAGSRIVLHRRTRSRMVRGRRVPSC